jgi:hypothetical protein
MQSSPLFRYYILVDWLLALRTSAHVPTIYRIRTTYKLNHTLLDLGQRLEKIESYLTFL